ISTRNDLNHDDTGAIGLPHKVPRSARATGNAGAWPGVRETEADHARDVDSRKTPVSIAFGDGRPRVQGRPSARGGLDYTRTARRLIRPRDVLARSPERAVFERHLAAWRRCAETVRHMGMEKQLWPIDDETRNGLPLAGQKLEVIRARCAKPSQGPRGLDGG